LHRAAVRPTQVDRVFAREPGILRRDAITHNKIGIGPLNAGPDAGRSVFSEVSILDGPVAPGRRYVVAWQNFVDRGGAASNHRPRAFIDEATIIRDTITEFERPVPATTATEAEQATDYASLEWAVADGLYEQEGASPRGERWVTETYEPGRADIRPCDGGI